MSIDPDRLRSLRVETRQCYTARDSILYALGIGIGLGSDATDANALRYLYEERLEAVPTMATALAYPGAWYAAPELGIDARKVVNAGQSLKLHQPLPVAATVSSMMEVEHIADKGVGKGVLLHTVRRLYEAASGQLLATIRQEYFCRDQGGLGELPQAALSVGKPIPDRLPDRSVRIVTRPEAALIYRLSGDLNPIHIDPAAAVTAGFVKPLLHGLATFGMAGYALLRDGNTPFRAIAARYSAPVFPGETLRCDIWDSNDMRAFRIISLDSGRIVLDRGRAGAMVNS